MNRRGIEFTLAQVEPGLWRWRFQIGDKVTTGNTKANPWAWLPAEFSRELISS